MSGNNKAFWNRTAKLYTSFQEKGNARLYEELVREIAACIGSDV